MRMFFTTVGPLKALDFKLTQALYLGKFKVRACSDTHILHCYVRKHLPKRADLHTEYSLLLEHFRESKYKESSTMKFRDIYKDFVERQLSKHRIIPSFDIMRRCIVALHKHMQGHIWFNDCLGVDAVTLKKQITAATVIPPILLKKA